jgi:hypothetical protein
VEQCKEEEGMETTFLKKKKNFKQDSEGNEENRHPVPDPNKTKLNDTKEPSDTHKNTLKDKILQVNTEKFMEKILDMVNQM